MPWLPRAHVYVSDLGNLFMTEIAHLLAAGLRDVGFIVDVRRTGVPQAEVDAVNFVVAPHEYFQLLGTDVHQEVLDNLEHCVLVLTEQPGSSWFDLSLAYASRARVILDINPMAVALLRSLGMDARLLPLGYHPSWDEWHGQPGERPVDVVFMGSATPRREEVLATMGSQLSALDCRILLHDSQRPHTAPAVNYVHGTDKFRLLASTKILLNVHRDETPYFEWHRALGALANGCVFLTETVVDADPLRPFDHFLMCDADLLPDYLALLLADRDLLSQVADDAYRFLRQEYDLASGLRGLLPFLEQGLADTPPTMSEELIAVLVAAFGGRDDEDHSHSNGGADGDGEVEAQKVEAQPGRVGGQQAEPPPGPPVQLLLKRQILAGIALRRRVDALECTLRRGAPQHTTIRRSPGYGEVTPEVSVVIPLHNYALAVTEAMESVLHSQAIVPELVVVDDHSSDGSGEVVERFMLEHPEFPLQLVTLEANVGLPETRNIGIAQSRCDFVFLLDADNWIYPSALRKLVDALSAGDAASGQAAFAYSMIECFGSRRKLLSAFPWSVDRLTQYPYIDAMTLIRKSAWEKVGGFASDLRIYGWEDYDFWLSMADGGHEGVLVPEILCCYRIHEDSMINVTNLDFNDTSSTVQSLHPTLPWPK